MLSNSQYDQAELLLQLSEGDENAFRRIFLAWSSTYKLQEGISADRHGMMIITNEGIVDIIRGKKEKTTIVWQ